MMVEKQVEVRLKQDYKRAQPRCLFKKRTAFQLTFISKKTEKSKCKKYYGCYEFSDSYRGGHYDLCGWIR